MLYKIPAEFIAAHGATLDTWAWPKALPLDEVFPQYGFVAGDRLEVIREGTVCGARAGTMMRMRKVAASLPAIAGPTAADIASVLKRRNPDES